MSDSDSSEIRDSEPKKDEPRLVFTEEGWSIEKSGQFLGPFEYLADINPIESSTKLNLQPKEVLALTLAIKNRIYRPQLQTSIEQRPGLPLQVESQDSTQRFIATASLGPEVPASGFIIFENQDWIAAEATYLYGTLTSTDSDKVSENECLQSVFFYSQTGYRGSRFSKDAVFKLGERTLRPSSKTLGSSGPPTLMILETGIRFLKGETVKVEDLYNLALAGLERFSNLNWDHRLYDVVSCIIISSYFYDLFNVFPITMIMGPFESGKTRLLLCIVYMGHRGMPLLDPSEASIFRTAEAWKGFLGIDEFWEISKEVERLLRATYKKGMKVPRIEKTKGGLIILSLFDLFGKVAIASQELFPLNILSKGIIFQLRKMSDPNPERRDPELRDFEEVRAKAYIARLTWAPEVKAYADRLDKQDLGLSGRDYEVWRPLLTIASMIGGQVWENVLRYAKESCEQKRQESYEELKEVLEAIYEIIKEKHGEFPVTFTPKQLHDLIWERQKDEYRITKEKQEVQGEVTEKYDYDTRRFEEVYNVRKIGRTYLRQLGLKGQHKKQGAFYTICNSLEFHELVTRYHPDLPNQERDYASLVLTSKITSQTSLTSLEPNLYMKNVGSQGDVSGLGDDINVTTTGNVTVSNTENKCKLGAGDVSEDSDVISREPHTSPSTFTLPEHLQPQPPFTHIGQCVICRQNYPLRPDRFKEWYVCQECYEKQPESR